MGSNKCCGFLHLKTGSIALGLFRLALWIIILGASLTISYNVFSLDRKGILYFKPRADIERNGYVVFLVLIMSGIGSVLEIYVFIGILCYRLNYFTSWFFYTLLSGSLSLLVACNFIASLLEVQNRLQMQDNWFFDGMCILSHMAFYFVPEFLLEPSFLPIFLGLLILLHLFLPILHFYSYYLFKELYSYMLTQRTLLHTTAPPILGSCSEISNDVDSGVRKPERHLCGNCQHKLVEREIDKHKGTYRRAESNILLPESTV